MAHLKQIRFLSTNKYKIEETQKILSPHKIEIIPVQKKINELQTTDMKELVRDKVFKAFDQIRRPLIVEHTGIEMESLGGFPGGLTQIFWDSVTSVPGAENFTTLFSVPSGGRIVARTVVGYCDGQNIYFFEGQIKGKISNLPKGPREFQWDCIFIPDGLNQTFAELGEKKNEISMRRKALDSLSEHLAKEQTWKS